MPITYTKYGWLLRVFNKLEKKMLKSKVEGQERVPKAPMGDGNEIEYAPSH